MNILSSFKPVSVKLGHGAARYLRMREEQLQAVRQLWQDRQHIGTSLERQLKRIGKVMGLTCGRS